MEELTKGVWSISDAGDLLDSFINITKRILGPPTCVALFNPYAKAAVDAVVDNLCTHLALDGAVNDESKKRIKDLSTGLAHFIVGNGLRPFMTKWIKIMEGVSVYQTLDDVYKKMDEVFNMDQLVVDD
jgi:hypothetical protein